jgi:hypothetical protein
MRVTAKEVGLSRLATRNRGRLRRAAGPALVRGKLVRNHAISGKILLSLLAGFARLNALALANSPVIQGHLPVGVAALLVSASIELRL